MRDRLNLLIVSAWTFLAVSCTAIAGPEINGYVVAVEKDRFLVTEFAEKAGKAVFRKAIWFSGKPANLQLGQKVKVWTDAMQESYPAQAHAEKCTIEKNSPAHEAIRKALLIRKKQSDIFLPFIVSVKQDQKSKSWQIQFADGFKQKIDQEPVTIKPGE